MKNLKKYLCVAISTCFIGQLSFAADEQAFNRTDTQSKSLKSATPSYLQRQAKRVRATPPPRDGMHLVMLGTRAGPSQV